MHDLSGSGAAGRSFERTVTRPLRYCFVCLMLISPVVQAQGGAGCFTLVSDLQRGWLDVKNRLLPTGENMGRPGSDDFVCVSRQRVRGAIERSGGVLSSGIRCFRDPGVGGPGFCCDQQLGECAQLNPVLFPDAYRTPAVEKAGKPLASDWVSPPGESQQWQSN